MRDAGCGMRDTNARVLGRAGGGYQLGDCRQRGGVIRTMARGDVADVLEQARERVPIEVKLVHAQERFAALAPRSRLLCSGLEDRTWAYAAARF